MTVLKPVLKWAGGKRQLLPQLRRFYPPAFGAYLEPFLGSAAVFLDLHSRGALEGHVVRLADDNADLIGTYTAVRDYVEVVIAQLDRLQAGHDRLRDRHYYEVRDGHFNPMRRRLGAACAGEYPPELAAMFIYLNRAGYNGLFRVNASGDFNVPVGRYLRPRICNPGTLRAVSAALHGVDLVRAPFAETLSHARPGDFVYLDPPYAPVSATANFTAYTSGGFGSNDQRTLRTAVVALARRGVWVVLSNSLAAEVATLYEDPVARAAGLQAHRVVARRAINSRPGRRGPVLEYVITNVQC